MNFKDKAIFIKNTNMQIKNSCQVAIISPGKGIYDYKVNDTVKIGQIVSVPLRNNIYMGVVIAKGSNNFPKNKLKVHATHQISSRLRVFWRRGQLLVSHLICS